MNNKLGVSLIIFLVLFLIYIGTYFSLRTYEFEPDGTVNPNEGVAFFSYFEDEYTNSYPTSIQGAAKMLYFENAFHTDTLFFFRPLEWLEVKLKGYDIFDPHSEKVKKQYLKVEWPS